MIFVLNIKLFMKQNSEHTCHLYDDYGCLSYNVTETFLFGAGVIKRCLVSFNYI